MFDLDVSKLAVIGAVALVVIGPEKMPRVARTVGTLLGKAQRYVSDVKAEVNRAMEMEDLKKMKETMDSAMTDVQSSVLNATTQLNQGIADLGQEATASDNNNAFLPYWQPKQPGTNTPAKTGVSSVRPCLSGTKRAKVCAPRPCRVPRGWPVSVRPQQVRTGFDDICLIQVRRTRIR